MLERASWVKRTGSASFLCMTLLTATSTCAVHAADTVGDVSVSLAAIPNPATHGKSSTHGYLEYRIALTNTATDADREVHLAFPAHGGGYGNSIEQITRSVVLAPGASRTVDMYQPPLPLSGSRLRVRVGSREALLPMSFQEHGALHYVHRSGGVDLSVLVSRDVDPKFRGRLSRYSSSVSFYQSEIPVSAWPGRWLGYSRYDGVIITAREAQMMHPEARQALWRYVECGGTLTVLGDWSPPATFSGPRRSAGTLDLLHHGFGVCAIVPGTPPADADRSGFATHVELWQESREPWAYSRDASSANRILQVVDTLRIPVRGLLTLVVLFAFVIGPANLFFLHRKKRRIWFLWTVPALSVLTCVAIWVYAHWAEGWSAHARTESLTLLDQRNMSAATIGWTGFYAPLTPGGGLHFSHDTEISPQVQGGRWDRGRSRVVDWTHDQHLRSGWVSARVPAHFMVRKSEQPVRLRIKTATGPDGSLTAINGLGVDLERLLVADRDGHIHVAEKIAAGQPTALRLEGTNAAGTAKALRDVYASEIWMRSFKKMLASPERYLRPGTYLALASEPLSTEEGLRGSRRRARSLIYGTLEASEP